MITPPTPIASTFASASQATEVEFRLAAVEGVLEIVIADDGKGFDAAAAGDGHGLKNLPARLAKLGGSGQVATVPGRGTAVTIRLPLTAPAVPTAPAAQM